MPKNGSSNSSDFHKKASSSSIQSITPNGGNAHIRNCNQTRIQKISQIISQPNQNQKQINRIVHLSKIVSVRFVLACCSLLLMLLFNFPISNNLIQFICTRLNGYGNKFNFKFANGSNGGAAAAAAASPAPAAEDDDAITTATNCSNNLQSIARLLHQRRTTFHSHYKIINAGDITGDNTNDIIKVLPFVCIGVIVSVVVGVGVGVINAANVSADVSKKIADVVAIVIVIAIAIKRLRHVIYAVVVDFCTTMSHGTWHHKWHQQQQQLQIQLRQLQLKLQQGICIIRLISLKRFTQIPTTACRQHQNQILPTQTENDQSNGLMVVAVSVTLAVATAVTTMAMTKTKAKNKVELEKSSNTQVSKYPLVKNLDKLEKITSVDEAKKDEEEKAKEKLVVEVEEAAYMNCQEKIECIAARHSIPKRLREHFAAFKLLFLKCKICRAAMAASCINNAAAAATATTMTTATTKITATTTATVKKETATKTKAQPPSPSTRDASTPALTSRPATAKSDATTLALTSAATKSPASALTRGTTTTKTTIRTTFRKLSSLKSSSQVECSSHKNSSSSSNSSSSRGSCGAINCSNNSGLVASGNVTGFVTVIGNGKKCGNPLQVSSQILALAKCVWLRLWWKCKWKSWKHPNVTNTNNKNGSKSSKSSDIINETSESKTLHFESQHRVRPFPSSSFRRLQRILITLILLSSLWQESVCFHGTVKLSSSTVKTKYGLLRGIVVRSVPSVVEAYLGIPYASPPVGSLRFMPPITPSTWKNVRNADRFSAVCPQTVPIPPNGPEALLEVPRARLAQLRRLLPLLKNQSEDCLYLNIYVPYETRRHRRFADNDESNPKLPTILFIHGESYEWNSGNPYDGSELAAHGNVIVVTINFRLGIFGFLKTGGKESAQGNFGLMDLVAGLHWLKENLPAFGGDPQSITVLGHGTGAALANILVVSPVASDLIQRTVLISGSALSPWAIQKSPLLVKRRVAEQTGCHGDMLYDDLAPCLRTKSVAELLAVTVDFPRFLVGFAPFVDGTVISPNINSIGALTLPLGSAIVSTSGIEYANFPKRDLIFGLTSVESYLDLSAQDLEFGFNETRRDRILRTFVRNNYHYHLNEIFAVLKNEYTDWEKAIRNPLSSRDATLAFLSDGHTASSLIKLGYMHSLRGGRGYFLHFKHKTMEEEFPQRTGSVRGEDVPFWFGLPVSPLFPYNYTTQEKQISRLMLRYLANFATTGNPNQSTKTSQAPSSSTSTITSNVVSQQQLQKLNSDSSINPDSQPTLRQMNHQKFKRSSLRTDSISRFLNLTSSQIYLDADASTRQALDLAIIYNQRRSNAMRDKRTNHRRHLRSNDEVSQPEFPGLNLDGDHLPYWDAYDVVNQLYLELGNKIEVLSHYRGHKLSMWLNLIPQLHKHSNINDQSMRHHQFADDIHNQNLYEGLVRPQLQTKPPDDEEPIVIHSSKATTNKTNSQTGTQTTTPTTTTECGVDGALLITTGTTQSPNDNRSNIETQKDLATASTGLIGNLEVLRRLSGKQFQSYTTALVATVAVGCFLLILNILIFAGIYHQREKRARDAKTKEELQDSDTSKNSSLMKLNTIGLSVPGEVGKTTVIFGEYNCYDEKTKQLQTAIDEKLLIELPPPAVQAALHDSNWACSTSTLDLLKTKHHHHATDGVANVAAIPNLITNEGSELQLHGMANLEMATYNPLTATNPIEAAASLQLQNKRGSFLGAANVAASLNLAQFDYAVQSSDQMSFEDIEKAVKATSIATDEITRDLDDDIPEPPPPPRSFQHQHQQQHQQQQQAGVGGATTSSGGGILRQSGSASATSSTGGKKRVHIQEISV